MGQVTGQGERSLCGGAGGLLRVGCRHSGPSGDGPSCPPPGAPPPARVPVARPRARLTSTSGRQFQTRLWHRAVAAASELSRGREAVRSAPGTRSPTSDRGPQWASPQTSRPQCAPLGVCAPWGDCAPWSSMCLLGPPSPTPCSRLRDHRPLSSTVTEPGERCASEPCASVAALRSRLVRGRVLGSSPCLWASAHASLFHCPPSEDS